MSNIAAACICVSLVLLVEVDRVLGLLHEHFVVLLFEQLDLVRRRADERKRHWQEEKSIPDAQDDDEKVHAEVVQLEERRGSEGQHKNTERLGGGDACDNRASHLVHGFHCAHLACALLTHKVHADMVAELDAEAERSDQVDHKDCIHFNRVASNDHVHHPHDAHKLEENQEDAERNENSNSETGEDLHDDSDRANSHNDVLEEDTIDVGVLIVVYVVEGVTEHGRGLILMDLGREHDRLSDAHIVCHLLEVVLRLHVLELNECLGSRGGVNIAVAAVGCQVCTVLVAGLASLNQTSDVVLLSLHHGMLEAESGGGDSTSVVEDHIERVLFATNTEALATLALDLDFDEGSHLLIEA